MNILKSEIYNRMNACLEFFQSRLDGIRQNSLILSNIDKIILLFLIALFAVSLFGTTNQIGAVSMLIPGCVIVKTLITKGEKADIEKWNFWFLVYLIICFISCFTSSLQVQSFYGFFKTFVFAFFYFSLCMFLKNNKNYAFILLLTIAAAVSAESIIGIFQNSLRPESISAWQDTSYLNPEDILTRVYGTLKPYNPNLFAGFLLAGFPSVIAMFVLCLRNKKHIFAATCGIFVLTSIYTIFLTGCRGSYIGLLFVLITEILAFYQIIFYDTDSVILRKIWQYFLSGLLILSGMFLALNRSILKRILSIFLLRGDSSTSFRINVYQSAIEMFKDNPVFGIGCGNKVFREIYGLYMLSGFDALSCYCVFLEIAVESGIFALIAYFMFLVTIIKTAIIKFISLTDFKDKIIILTCIASIIGVIVHGFTDTIYFRPAVQYIFWTMAAILTVYIREENTETI